MLTLAASAQALHRARFSALATDVLGALGQYRLAYAQEQAELAIHQAEEALTALVTKDENAANHGRLLALYFRCLSRVAQFWRLALDGDFRAAWDRLIDAENAIRAVHRNCPDAGSHGLLALAEQLELVQLLYPYSLFSSIEMLVKVERCSACERSPWDPACGHRTGDIVGGQLVYTEVRDAELIGMALTRRPKDKRLVILPMDGEPDYSRVAAFLEMATTPFVRLVVQPGRRIACVGSFEVYAPGAFLSAITRDPLRRR